MSVTTWKTTSPTLWSKISDFLLCVLFMKKKQIKAEEPDPELEYGIGTGMTAHEIVEQYNLKKRQSFGETMSVKSLLGKEKGKKGDLLKEADAIRNKKTKGKHQSKSKDLIKAAVKKEKNNAKKTKPRKTSQMKLQVQRGSDDENMKWLMQAWNEDEEEDDAAEDADKKAQNSAKSEQQIDDDEVSNKMSAEDLLDKLEQEAGLHDDEEDIPESAEDLHRQQVMQRRASKNSVNAGKPLSAVGRDRKDNGGSQSSKTKSDKNNNDLDGYDDNYGGRITSKNLNELTWVKASKNRQNSKFGEGSFGLSLPDEEKNEYTASRSSSQQGSVESSVDSDDEFKNFIREVNGEA